MRCSRFPRFAWVTLRLLQFGVADCRVAVRTSECDRGVSVTSAAATAAATVGRSAQRDSFDIGGIALLKGGPLCFGGCCRVKWEGKPRRDDLPR